MKKKKEKEKNVYVEDLNVDEYSLANYRYTYAAKVVSVYDGDTIRVIINLGFGVTFNGYDGRGVQIRLFGIDTPELRGEEREEGLVVRDWLREKILDKEVILKSIKDKKGKYGRYLADIYIEDVHINGELIEMGYDEEY